MLGTLSAEPALANENMEPEAAETERMRFRGETEPSSLLVLSSISSSESLFSSVSSFTPLRMCVPPS